MIYFSYSVQVLSEQKMLPPRFVSPLQVGFASTSIQQDGDQHIA